ncbi:glycosyltransferase family 4 protein [Corynebacterium sanguinis]|uniref:glycosyltransferase family 4 protein n=1 Tax=Corynebacterium sanguinis TaxID=2594913 RepID=UPI0011870A8C|nr:glycosyltransferase family 4 protein [Corynebacterium sanguinis]MCT1598444.1 glycosyltransferase family 4 protein [Corynebacterium sanguinis]MCT1629499.1 glycosyltransferase family 4 protein [Corynebacterium sanguinis]QDR77782.1 glycosyltransferase [Corynebacterium sanguinis]
MDRKDVKLLSINAGSAVSGAEKVLRDLLAYALAEGEEVVLASPGGPVTTATPSGIRHLEIPHQIPNANPASGSFRKKALTLALPLLWLRTAAALAPEMRRADTVLVNSTFALPAVALASAFSRTRVVWLVHDTLTAGKQKVAARMGAVAVDTAVAVSETTAAVIRPFFREVVVRPNGVEIPADEFFTQQRRRNNEGRVVGMLAAIKHWKAQDVLIRALGILRGREGIDVDVEIAGGVFPGSETYAAELSALVSELGLDGHVRFLGHVPKESAFARWDALISASRRPEAGPLGVLEAMAHRVPVIATNHGGSADYLRGGRGVLVPPEHPEALALAVRQLLADPSWAVALEEEAFAAVVEEHDLSRTIPQMWEAVRS